MKKRIFVNIFVDNVLYHNRCALDIDQASNGNNEAADLAIEIARENGFPIETMRFEIVKNGRQPFGFPDLTDFINKNPGNIKYHCEYCGMYEASRPRCNNCKKDL